MKFSLETLFDINKLVRELSVGLRRLDFINNFQSFEVTDQLIPANEEIKIRNQLNSIPTKMIITKQSGNALITIGDTAWDSNYIYIQNNDATNDATVDIIFFK